MKKNKLYKFLISALMLLSLSLISCDNWLEPELDGNQSEDAIWKNSTRAFGILNNAYFNLPTGYNRIAGAMLDAATDDAICPDPLNPIHGIYNGNWSPYNIIDNVWTKNYEGIRKVNNFLTKIDSVPLPKVSNILGTSETIYRTRERMKGEAFFLRAFFYFELVKRYGGVPLTSIVLTPEEASNLPRATIKECFEFILSDCDSATNRLPRKYGADPVIVGYNDAKEIGRATSGASKALKSRALLYWASPLFNSSNDKNLWVRAADAANEVLNLKINEDGSGDYVYRLNRFSSVVNMTNLVSTNPLLSQYHREIIFSTQYYSMTTVDRQNAPISFGGLGLTNPTQNLIDAFPMNNGKSIYDPESGYDSSNPYVNRDPRLAMTVLLNGTNFAINDKASIIETYDGGKDGPGSYPNSTKTGYYLQKFLQPSAVWDGRTVNVMRTWILFRFAETYLNYAEARNEAYGPDQEVYSTLKALRARAGFRISDITPGLSKEQMREFIQNERRVELAFEEHRFFDTRRWMLFENPIHKEDMLKIRGARIIKQTDNSIFFSLNNTVQNRAFESKMYFYPIAESELLKNKSLNQNSGW